MYSYDELLEWAEYVYQEADVAVVHADLNGRFLHVNESAMRLFGYSLEELQQKTFKELTHAEDLEKNLEYFRLAIAGKLDRYTMEKRYIRKGGKIIHARLRVTILKNLLDRPYRILAIVEDLTQIKQTQNRLERTISELNQALTLGHVARWEENPCNGNLIWSPQVYELLHLDPGEPPPSRRHLQSLCSEESWGRLAARMAAIRQTGGRVVEDLHITLADRTHKHLHAVISSTPGPHPPYPLVGLLQDITPLRQAEEERRHLESQLLHVQKLESLGVLAGGIAHDFNNLLMGILGNADLAHDDLYRPEDMRRHLTQITATARRASDLCRELLAYSGKGSFVIATIDLANLVQSMSELLQVTLGSNVTLKFEAPHPPYAVEVDSAQMQQIVMNLITNASDALREKPDGRIRLRIEHRYCEPEDFSNCAIRENLEAGNYVVLGVLDNGCGIEPAVLDQIFDPFYSSKRHGRGLGLAAVLGIVKGHRGSLQVQSNPGRGTLFEVYLPASEQPVQMSLPQDLHQNRWDQPGRSKKILLVDDDPVSREVCQKILEALGFEVVAFDAGSQALKSFAADPRMFHGAMIDMSMPEMPGEEVLKRLRHIREDLPVLMMSGYNESILHEAEDVSGVSGFLAKPFNRADVSEALRQILS